MTDTGVNWQKAISLAELESRSRTVVKLDGKQILLLLSGGAIYACNNRCPHEGFPLSEGTLSEGCVLTCNWHSWRFDLESGETLTGGDALRRYSHEIRDGDIWLDVSDPPQEAMRAKALAGMKEAFDEHDYTRIAREVARFERAGGDADTALRHAFEWTIEGLETGTSHAHAAAPDWLRLRSTISADDLIERRIPVVEIIGHLSWDVLMQNGPFPLTEDEADNFDPDRFEQAIEDENESVAIAQARAGLREGGGQLLRPSLERASLRHYQNFGHSVIYLDKVYELIGVLGEQAEAALLLPLVRSFCTTAREDLIPEFKAYAPALAKWDNTGEGLPGSRCVSRQKCCGLFGPDNSGFRPIESALSHTDGCRVRCDASLRPALPRADRQAGSGKHRLAGLHSCHHASERRPQGVRAPARPLAECASAGRVLPGSKREICRLAAGRFAVDPGRQRRG